MAKVGAIAGRMYHMALFFLLSTIVLGAAFIATSMSSRFFKWSVEGCSAFGNVAIPGSSDLIVDFNLDMTVDIGWREFTVTSLDQGTETMGECLGELKQGQTYSIGDYQDNNASLAGLGMVASWALGVLVALYTFVALLGARHGQRRGGVSLKMLTNWCALFTVGLVTATTVFWWLIEGKFGKRQESLAPRLFQRVEEGAELCSNGSTEDQCNEATWSMDAPGWALSMGVTAMFAFGAATFLLWIIAPRVDHLNSGIEEIEVVEPAKPPVGNIVMEKTPLPEEKTRGKDRRSAKTGVRAGGKAPSSTVQGGDPADAGPDPMTYALEEGRNKQLGSVDDDDDDEEVVYQNHQVHHAVINHSNPNPTQMVEDQGARQQQQQQQLNRGYSRATSGGSYATGGGRSFDERSEGDYSETASSSQYYGGGHGGQSFMSSSSRGESDEYR
ncbi:unnamed protein product [Ectocarpus sp. CCAP 1310/34]|nr:unnamed protein product [Ectocarpus sp. CCAP 1310/34]